MAARGCISLLLVVLSPLLCEAVEYGDLIGRFTYGGDPPKRHPIFNPHPAIAKPAFDESLLVGREGGIANVVVELLSPEGNPISPHSRYDRLAQYPSTIHIANARFVPRIATVCTNQTLRILNLDSTPHCAAISTWHPDNNPVNPLLPPQARVALAYAHAERRPVKISCSVHPWLNGYVVIRDHPYVAVTDDDGRFRLRDLPVGKHTFRVWQEQSDLVKKVTVADEVRDWKAGRFEFEIRAGEQRLGNVRIPPEAFTQ